MEEFDKIKDKITNYHSPLSVEEEWNTLLIKKENIALQKKLRRRNLIISFITLLLLCLFGTCSYCKQNGPRQKEEITLNNEQKTIYNNRQTQSIGLEKKNIPKIKEAENIRITSSPSSRNNELLNEQQKTKLFYGKDKNTDFHTESNLIQENKLTTRFGDTQNQDYIKSNLNANTQSPENSFTNTKESTTKNVIEDSIQKLPTLQMKLILNDTFKILPLPKIDSTKVQPSIAQQRNYLSLELLGQGAFYSLNYGRTIGMQLFGKTDLQIGISYSPLNFTIVERIGRINTMLVPLSINQSIRLKGNHHLTFGLGFTLMLNRNGETQKLNSFFLGKYKLGYLYLPKNKRIFFRAEVLSPFYFSDPNSGRIFPCLKCDSNNKLNNFQFAKPKIWGGVGIGWRF